MILAACCEASAWAFGLSLSKCVV